MDFFRIATIVFPIFILIGLGLLGGKTRLLSGDSSGAISGYVYYFALPALLFLRVAETPIEGFFDLNLGSAYSFGIVAVAVIVWIIGYALKIDPEIRGMLALTTMFGNVAYMGIPFSTFAFGNGAQAVTALTIALTIILTNFWALGLGQGMIYASINKTSTICMAAKAMSKKMFSNPLVISIILGMIFSALKINIPELIKRPLELLAETAGPTALFALGVFFAGKSLFKNFKTSFAVSLVKLLALPFLTFIFFRFFPTDPVKISVAVSQAAMPMAATNFVFAKQWNIAPELVGSSIMLSTVISVITLSLLLVFIG